MSNRNNNLPLNFTFQFNVTSSGTPEKLTIKIVASTIAFNDNDPEADTITDSTNGFLVAGFQPNDMITVSGSGSNNGTYIIKTVTAGIITLQEKYSLTTEIAGSPVKIVASKTVPDGISVNIKAKNTNTGLITIGYSSATALNSGTGYMSLNNNESIGIQINDTQNIWLDSTVSGEGVEVWFEKNLQE